MRRKGNNQKWYKDICTSAPGFTFLELILVIAIIFILSAAAVPFYARFLSQNDAANVTDQLIGSIRKAQMYTMMGRKNSSWGVHYASNKITLYKGSTFGVDNTFNESFTTSPSISITGFSDINIAGRSGYPNSAPTITISSGSTNYTIIVTSQGAISRQ